MKPWRLAKALDKLRGQINAASPHRNKASDGTIADLAHSKRVSDHNPNSAGVVTAMDITSDSARGVDGTTLSRALITDPRTKYVIFNGEIWKARTGKWERYTGPSPHKHHVHISVTPVGADDDREWELNAATKPEPPTLRRGDKGLPVIQLQWRLTIKPDGKFGPATEKAVKEFQKANGLTPDGVVGVRTWRALNKANPQIP